MKDAKRLGYFKGHQDWVTQARFTPDGKWLMTSSADRTFKLWNIYNFQPVFTIDDCSMVGTQFCITGSGKYILTTDTSDNLRVHELTVALAAAASTKK
jgi:WD40 repeat protein